MSNAAVLLDQILLRRHEPEPDMVLRMAYADALQEETGEEAIPNYIRKTGPLPGAYTRFLPVRYGWYSVPGGFERDAHDHTRRVRFRDGFLDSMCLSSDEWCEIAWQPGLKCQPLREVTICDEPWVTPVVWRWDDDVPNRTGRLIGDWAGWRSAVFVSLHELRDLRMSLGDFREYTQRRVLAELLSSAWPGVRFQDIHGRSLV